MKKTAFLSDVVFAFSIAFLVSVCFFRYLKFPLPVAALLSLLCGGLAAIGSGAWMQRKRKRFLLRKSDELQKRKLLTHLCLLSNEKQTEFFLRVFSKEQAQRISALKIATETNAYFIKIRFSPVTADEIAAIARWKTAKEKILLCAVIDEDAKTLCERLFIQVYTENDVYALVRQAGAMPQTFLGETDFSKKGKRKLRLCFSKRNSRQFLVGGALLLLSSLYSPFPTYYLIFGSILTLCSLFIRIFGYAN